MGKVKKTVIPFLLAGVLLSGCASGRPGSSSALEQTSGSTRISQTYEAQTTAGLGRLQEESEVREGTSDDTLATPPDFPQAYDYGTGRIEDGDYSIRNKRLPEPTGNETVLHTIPDPTRIQALYLWEEGNVPAQTEVSDTMTGYYDEPDFRPYLTAIPVQEETEVKGAVVLLAGGGFPDAGELYRHAAYGRSFAGAGFSNLYCGLPPKTLYPTRRRPGRREGRTVYSQKCRHLRHPSR